MSTASVPSEESLEETMADAYAQALEPLSRDTIEEERQLIGFALVHPEALTADVLSLPSECFSSPGNRILWEVAVDRSWRGLGFDMTAVVEYLRDAYPEYRSLPERAHEFAVQYGMGVVGVVMPSLADVIRKGHFARRTEKALTDAWQHLSAGRPDKACEAMAGLDPDESSFDPWHSLGDAWQVALTEAENPDALIPTPWPTVNKYLSGGLKAREIYIAAGMPGAGKTALAQGLADHAARKGTVSAVFSLEMGETDLARRMMSTSAGIGMDEVMRPGLDMTAESYTKADDALAEVGERVIVDDSADLTISQARNHARVAVRRYNAGLLIFDYAQLVDHDDRRLDEREVIADVLRQLKKMAKELRVPVVVLAQPNRNAVLQGRKLAMTDLYGSGALERFAASVILLNKIKKKNDDGDEVDTPFVDFDIDKNRFGPTGSVRMMADLGRQRFEELAKG